MDKLVVFNNSLKKKLTNKRSGESKFGEHIQILPNISNIYEQLKSLDVKYVILGIPEDIGVFANYGKIGASKAWEATLKFLLNIQSNEFTKANEVLILGHLDFTDELNEVSKLDQSKKKHINKARLIVENIDKYVTNIIYQIVSAGKKPIVIGGGHNNAYGNIKGASLALNKPINVINFDAHSDFRPEDGRHSGNGFTYAYSKGFMCNYFIFGLHENYTSDKVFKTIDKIKTIDYTTFESIEVRKELKFKKELSRAQKHITDTNFGIEIDCDAIVNIPTSAETPSGFTIEKTRQFLHFFSKAPNATYLHICEASPKNKSTAQVGKLITFLITDFIRAHDY